MKNLKNKATAFSLMLAFSLMSLLSVSSLQAQQAKLITVKSTKSFNATVDGIKKGVSNAGMMVLAEINHGKILSMTGLSIKAESLFIGNPTVGKNAFSDNKAVGLAIPLRLNVYEENGATYINYFTPSSELGYFDGAAVKTIGAELDKKIQMLIGMFSN